MDDSCVDNFPEPALVDDFPEPVHDDLRATTDCLGAATPNPGTPERWCFRGDTTDDNVRRLAEGEGVDSGRLPTELNGAIDCFLQVKEKLFPQLP